MSEKTLFEQVGGKETLDKVHKIFYDKVYEHPWLKLFFMEVKQEIIEEQQTAFMTKNFGGPDAYLGKLPVPAHKHMFLTEEIFQARKQALTEALDETQVPENLKEKWLKIDEAFKSGILKKDISECVKRFNTDEIEAYEDPSKPKKWAA